MERLYQNDCRALSSALETIYSTMSIEEFPDGVLSAVRKILSCNTICYNEITLPDSMTVWVTEPAGALPSPPLREAFMRNFTEHPVLVHSARTGDGSSYRISDFLSQRQFHDLALYSEYYKKSGVEYQLLTAISLSPGQMMGVALDRDCADFSENERLSLDLLRPHLVQAYRNVQSIDLMKRVIEGRGRKLLMVGRSGQVRLVNDDIWRLITRFFDVSRSLSSLPDLLNRWINRQRSRFSDELDVPTPSTPLVISKGNRRLSAYFLWGGKSATEDMLLLEEEPVELASELLVDSELTRREVEILSWLSRGKTNTEIGLALSISPRTVKKHLEHIYSKLQVHRRGAAVARSYHL